MIVRHGGVECKLIEIDSIIDTISGYGLTDDQTKFIENNGIILADPESVQGNKLEIDILIGQDYFHSIIMDGRFIIPGNLMLLPVFNRSFALTGRSIVATTTESDSSNPVLTTKIVHFDTLSPQDEQRSLDRFVSLEALGIGPLAKEISPILAEFNKTTYHNGERYVIKLPWKIPQKHKLATNFSQAFFRLVSSQKRYRKEKYKIEFQKYEQIMREQLDLGILEKVEPLGTIDEVIDAINNDPHAFDKIAKMDALDIIHYLAHHGVYKASTGTLRIVYDAAAKAMKGAYSLNDCLETGPDLMNSLVGILLRFRKFRYGAKADIAKAFLMIEIDIKDRNALRLLWVVDGIVWVFRFARLPFGLTSSPFILAAVLLKHLGSTPLDDSLKDQIMSSFYVDDNIFSEDSVQALLNRKELSVKVFREAGMNLRSWTTNNNIARTLFSNDDGEDKDLEETVLGLLWDLKADTISVNSKRITELIGKTPTTKRRLNSYVAQLYDPLGIVAPFTAKAKFFVRAAAEECKGWDTKLPSAIGEGVQQWTREFTRISQIRLPRWVGVNNCSHQMLVGFCDASIKALGACVYLVSTNESGTVSHLIKANSRIKPPEINSIPRLELVAAEMLCNLMTMVRKAFPEIGTEDIYYFTDSAVVLYWLYSGSYSWPILVANRVTIIKSLSDIEHWLHVDTTENPADIASRSCDLADLIDNDLWFHGPSFITRDIRSGKSTLTGYAIAYELPKPDGIMNEIKTVLSISTRKNGVNDVHIDKIMNIERFGTYKKLMTASQFMLKFVHNLFNSINKIPNNVLFQQNVFKYTLAEIFWIQAIQRDHFKDLFSLCNDSKATVSACSKLIFREHHIYLDQELGILRCSSRMQNSQLKSFAKSPILIPSKSWFTYLLIKHAHETVGHNGVPQTLSHLRNEFWILQGRRTVKSVIKDCVPCRRVHANFYSTPAHPPLPDFRINKARCFNSIGTDYTGPYNIRDPLTGTVSKAYILIFTCASSRAVHLEATNGMGTLDFILAFQRFMNVRGIPEKIASDNGPSFVRANKQLGSIFQSKRVSNMLDQKRIQWSFYTAFSPWMGGFIERLNSILKNVCHKTFRKSILSFDEFRSMVSFIMAIMNDRPLTYVYSDFSDEGTILTPSMLLNGFQLLEHPHLNLRKSQDQSEISFGERYEILERLKEAFWNLFSTHYLNELSERHVKQGKTQLNYTIPQIGDIVLIKKEKVKRCQWRLGKIIDTRISNRDGVIRQCTVKTTSKKGKCSILNRSPSFLVPLEIKENFTDRKCNNLTTVNKVNRIRKNVRFQNSK